MRLTFKGSSGRYEKSGTAGKPGRGYGKGWASSNPDKWKPRTEAQAKKSQRVPRTWR